MEEGCSEIDNARDAKNSSLMHSTLQELKRDFRPKMSAINDKNGKTD